jgi:small GTP-binding protein
MRAVSVLVTGPFNSGKSTLIKTLGGRFSIDVELAQGAKPTTVFMDYGTIELDGHHVRLYGTPGQSRFRPIIMGLLTLPVSGYVFVVDSSDPTSLAIARGYYQAVRARRPDLPHVVAANKRDRITAAPLQRVRHVVGVPEGVEVLPLIARDRASAEEVLRRLLTIIADK